ncbi:MAG TPA: hypothetical protein VFV34_28015 [Blastocatellia bacterium]|nr:hypothetical protein [Blastocatellia bacterium]
MPDASDRHPAQDRVDSMLRRAVVLSIIWLLGFGSCVSIIQAIRAQRMIKSSGGQITGMGKVWWCYIVGGSGVLFWGFVLLMMIVNSTKP